MSGMRLGLVWVGKTKSVLMRTATEEAAARLRAFSRLATLRTEEIAGRDPERQLLRRAEGARLWLLDPGGRTFTSPQFASFLEREGTAHAGKEVLFAVGGADGFAAQTAQAAAGRVSLSPLTLSHELARLVALEQIYRACAILTNHPYPH